MPHRGFHSQQPFHRSLGPPPNWQFVSFAATCGSAAAQHGRNWDTSRLSAADTWSSSTLTAITFMLSFIQDTARRMLHIREFPGWRKNRKNKMKNIINTGKCFLWEFSYHKHAIWYERERFSHFLLFNIFPFSGVCIVYMHSISNTAVSATSLSYFRSLFHINGWDLLVPAFMQPPPTAYKHNLKLSSVLLHLPAVFHLLSLQPGKT